MTAKPAVLLVGALVALTLLAPPVAASGVPEPICQVLCILVILIASCVAAEAQQHVVGGAGCSMIDIDPGVAAIQCFVQDLESRAGLADPCPPA